MIEIIKDVPDHVAAFRATGAVSKEDYDNVLIPQIENLLKRLGHINFLLVLDTSLSNFTISAMLKDLGIGLKHYTKWNKMAVVSDSSTINHFTDFFSYLVPGKAKGFEPSQLEEAKAWVST